MWHSGVLGRIADSQLHDFKFGYCLYGVSHIFLQEIWFPDTVCHTTNADR